MFDPNCADNAISRYNADKLERCDMVMQTFRYVIEYVPEDGISRGICYPVDKEAPITNSHLR